MKFGGFVGKRWPITAFGTRPFRPFFPGALLLIGGAVCCWCSCFNGPSAPDIRAMPQNVLRRELTQMMPAGGASSTPDRERLRITGTRIKYQITAIGNFSPDAARNFVNQAKNITLEGQRPNLLITIYSDAGGGRTLLGTFSIEPAADLERTLRANLPAPLNEIPPDEIKFRITALAHGTVKRFVIYIVGPFTAESADLMANQARRVYDTMPGQTSFMVRILAPNKPVPIMLEQFELGAER